MRLALIDPLLDHVELQDVLDDLGVQRLLQALKHGAARLYDAVNADVDLATFDILCRVVLLLTVCSVRGSLAVASGLLVVASAEHVE